MNAEMQEIYNDLKTRYKAQVIGKKELAKEFGISLSTVDLYMAKGMGIPPYIRLGNSSNSRIVFTIYSVAKYLSANQIQTQ